MTYLFYILTSLAFLFIGIFIGRKMVKIDGMFIVDDSDDETTKWTLDVKFDPANVLNKKELRFLVKKINEGDV